MTIVDTGMHTTSPLCASQLVVEIEDLHAECTLTHTFRNDGSRSIEAVFSFPIPLDAAFLSLQANLGGETVDAVIQPKADAERTYSDAISQGDSAVLLTQPEPGVLCLNLGNLSPGESGEVVLRFAVWMRVANSEARFSLPLVHRPRYGRWRLEDIEAPTHDLGASYPLTASIAIRGLLHGGSVRCSTHAARFHHDAGQTVIALEKAMLDADVVVAFSLPEALPPQIRVVEDGDHYLAWAAACIPLAKDAPSPLNLCLVMDCSGSMQGDAILQSRQALRLVADHLDDSDRIQIIRFGSTHNRLFRRPLVAVPAVRTTIRELAQRLNANLGGTEMDQALCAAIEQLSHSDSSLRRAIILVTDGAVQPADIQNARELACAREIGIFVVAVGSAAGVDVLAPLAESTRAALERAVPAEPIDENVLRQMTRARAGISRGLSVVWPDPEGQPIPLPEAFPGEMAMAAVQLTTPRGPAHLGDEARMPIELPSPKRMPALRALLGQRLYAIASESSREQVAVRYGLLTAHTSAVLVKAGSGEEGAELPDIIKVPQMVPRGMLTHQLHNPSPMFSRKRASTGHLGFSGDSSVCLSAPPPACDDFSDDDLVESPASFQACPPPAYRTVTLSPEERRELLTRLYQILRDWLSTHGSLWDTHQEMHSAIARQFTDQTQHQIVEDWLTSASAAGMFRALHAALGEPPLEDELEAKLTTDLLRLGATFSRGVGDDELARTLEQVETEILTWLNGGYSVSDRSKKQQ